MSQAADLLEQVLNLPEPERAKIATRLLESLDPVTQDQIDESWANEIERRCEAVDTGALATSSWEDVRARIEKDLFGR